MHPILPDSHPSADKTLGDVMELNSRCIAAAAVLADYQAALASAPLASPPGREWMLRLASVLGNLLDALDDPAGEGDDLDGREPYCAECGAWIGMFIGRQGWHHYRGNGTVASPVEIYDAGHEASAAWCEPPGRAISPAGAVTIAQALADAEAYRRRRAGDWCADCAGSPAGACGPHLDDLDQADAYAGLGRQLQQEEGQ